jgi:CheY-like chemotaxis protein
MNANTKVLIADDDEIFRIVMKDCLDDAGFEVILASSIDEADKLICEADIIVMDAVLPHSKGESLSFYPGLGIEFLFRMITSGSIETDKAIIVVSEFVTPMQEQIRQGCRQNEIDETRFVCLDKPFTCDVFVEIIRREFKKRI